MTHILVSPTLEQKNTQATVKLQNIILPNIDVCTEEELFLRSNSKCLLNYEQNMIELKQGGIISFDTYFNSFSIKKWQEYTNIQTISIKLRFQGKFLVKLINVDNFSDSAQLIQQTVIYSDENEVSIFNEINLQSYKGLLYLEIEALKNNCQFFGGYFCAELNNYSIINKKIAIVICTYKRENYIYKNIDLLKQKLINNPDLKNKFEIFIIDNGRTLKDLDNPDIHLLHNKNAGGSGGYTRGIIEVLKRKSDFSHIIFMDDDVVVAPEVFERIYNFQSAARDQNLCIGGSMLRLDAKYIQHENGAVWDREVTRLKPDLDLRSLKNVLLNELEEYINYNGWWLFCFPIQVIDDSKLPYPFFIKMDDMELPIRLNLKIITLNGICVWHEALETKYSPLINYYLRKNELIINTLYTKDFNQLDVIKYIIKYTIREAFCYKYKSANIILKAAEDFLRGPDYLRCLDPEEKNVELLSLGEKAVKGAPLPFLYTKYEKSIDETENTIHRLMRLITLNGHILPPFLFHKDSKLTDKGYKIAPIHGYRPLNLFRAKKGLYYNLVNQEGFVVKFSREEFFKVLFKTISTAVEIFYKFPTIKQIYKETLPELTNQAFWESYLEINKHSQQKI